MKKVLKGIISTLMALVVLMTVFPFSGFVTEVNALTHVSYVSAKGQAIIYNGHSYALYIADISYEEAEEVCKKAGGHLVTITSLLENKAVSSMISGKNCAYWIGLSKNSSSPVWIWNTGEMLRYSNWASNEPFREDCVAARICADTAISNAGYYYSKGEWDGVINTSGGTYGHNVKAAGFICEWEYISNAPVEKLNKVISVSSEIISIYVTAKKKNIGTVPVRANVTIYSGKGAIMTKQSGTDGYVRFSKASLYAKGLRESDLKNCTVSAHFNVNSSLELCSEDVNSSGNWIGQPLLACNVLTCDEPRWNIYDLDVMVNQSSVQKAENILRDYSFKFANATNGHVIIKSFNIFTVPDSFIIFPESVVAQFAKNRGIDICMVKHSSTGAWSGIRSNTLSAQGGLSNTNGGYYYPNEIIWCPVNANDCAKTLCHESGHYLFGFFDEYCSAAGAYGTTNGWWSNPNDYSLYYVFDKSGNHVIDYADEKHGAYWDIIAGKNLGGAISRPKYAPSNFGLMEYQYTDLEMSTSYDYLGADISNPWNCTTQYFFLSSSCEEKMEYELNNRADGYAIDYTKVSNGRDQTADYWFAGNDNVVFNYRSALRSALRSSAFLESVSEKKENLFKDINFLYADSKLNIMSEKDLEITLKTIDESFCESVISDTILSDENNHTADLTIDKNSIYTLTVVDQESGMEYSGDLSIDYSDIDSQMGLNNEKKEISLTSELSNQSVIITDNSRISNNDYASVTQNYFIVTSNNSEINGTIEKSISFDLDIDYNSLKWFKYADNEWQALETVLTYDDHGNPSAYSLYSGDGLYSLMAKQSGNSTISLPTNFTVSNDETTYDKEVTVKFDDNNDNILNYNVYYSEEAFSSDNLSECEIQVVPADCREYTFSVEKNNVEYYFAIEAVGMDGSRSSISEIIACRGSLLDDNDDGIPNFWINEHGLTDSETIFEEDSDEDGLTNIQEYQLGTNPINPDSDGDNVYDGIEVLNSLDPLSVKSNDVTDDYIRVYGTPNLKFENAYFNDDYVNFVVKNISSGKAMRTVIKAISDGETFGMWTVNVDAYSSVEVSIEKEKVCNLDSFEIVLDEDNLTRDSDCSNNIFEYEKGLDFSVKDCNLFLGQTAIITESSGDNIYSYCVTNGESIIVDNLTGRIEAYKLGQSIVEIESIDGVKKSCVINVASPISINDGSPLIIDFDKKTVCGITDVKLLSTDFVFEEGYHCKLDNTQKAYTNMSVYIIDENSETAIILQAVIFGDVNGDGWYDGQDAVTVSMIAGGMLTREQVGEAVWMAADCNHDGVIDQADVELLNQAGVLLSNVDQTKTSDELLETSAEYVEYLNLIDQQTDADSDETPEDNTEENEEPTELNLWNIIVNYFVELIKKFLSVIKVF